MLSGCATIRAYHREDEIGSRFDRRNADAMDAYYSAEYSGALLGPSVNFINNFSISLIMIFGGILYMFSQNGTVAEGTLFLLRLAVWRSLCSIRENLPDRSMNLPIF